MKQFLAVFIGSESSPSSEKWNALSEAQQQESSKAGKTAWMNWAEKNKSSIVNHGSPLGKTKRADPSGVSNIKNQMTAFSIVQAESHEEAAKLFLNHPHFMIFPGDSVEIMECLPMPTL